MCNRGGKSLFSLLKWIKSPTSKRAELASIIGATPRIKSDTDDARSTVCELPDEFIPLWNPGRDDFTYNAAINYLRSRDVHYPEILKYGIGFCADGAYSNMIIIPSYDRHGMLNYFISRSFLPNARITFKNPPVPKDVVGFELLINWSEPIILVESVFDAIALKRNAIPLFGKTISPTLRSVIINRNVSDVIICLDADAISDALNHCDFFLGNGINTRVVELPGEEDPSSLGYSKTWELISSTSMLEEMTLFERRIKDQLYGEGKTHLPHRRHSLQTVSTAQRISGSFQSTVRRNIGDRY